MRGQKKSLGNQEGKALSDLLQVNAVKDTVSYALCPARKRPLRLRPALNMVHVLLWKVYR